MLGAIFPHAEYAEDQLRYKTILTAHVGYRGFQLGAILGAATGVGRAILLRRKSIPTPILRIVVLNSIGVGSVIGLGLVSAFVHVSMIRREKIEWQDRSWRLLANKPQEEVDNWTVAGSIVGATAFAIRGGRSAGWKPVMGAAAVGNLTALGALMVWRMVVRKDPQENIRPSGPVGIPKAVS